MKSKKDEVKNYSLSKVKLEKKFQNPISKVIYIPDLERIAFYEEGTNEIHFMNYETGTTNQKSLKIQPSSL